MPEHLERVDADYVLVHALLDRERFPLVSGARTRPRIVYRSRPYALYDVR